MFNQCATPCGEYLLPQPLDSCPFICRPKTRKAPQEHITTRAYCVVLLYTAVSAMVLFYNTIRNLLAPPECMPLCVCVCVSYAVGRVYICFVGGMCVRGVQVIWWRLRITSRIPRTICRDRSS